MVFIQKQKEVVIQKKKEITSKGNNKDDHRGWKQGKTSRVTFFSPTIIVRFACVIP